MAKIKIDDLPRDRKLGKDEMKAVLGGIAINGDLDSTALTPDAVQQGNNVPLWKVYGVGGNVGQLRETLGR